MKDEDAINILFKEKYTHSDRVLSEVRCAVFDGFLGGWQACRNKMLTDFSNSTGMTKAELNKALMEKQRGQK